MSKIRKYKVKKNVGFLFDKKNKWISNYINKDSFKDDAKFNFKFSFDYRKYYNYDIIFVLGYTKILKNNFLKKNKLVIVCHESELPKGRGFSPLQWQILENKNKISIILFEADIKVDEGLILEKDVFYLNGTELYDEIRKKQAAATKKIIKKFLSRYPKISKSMQSGSPSYYKKRSKADSMLNINKTIKNQFNLLRIVNNKEWPAFFIYKKKKYKILIYEEK